MPRGRINNELRTPVHMRFDTGMLRKVRELAEWKGTAYQTLMHLWLVERVNSEWTNYQLDRRRLNPSLPKKASRS